VLYRDRGVVLRTHKLGEADRIVSFMSEGRGKVRAVAKGVRKTHSKFGARLEPTSHVALQLHEGRNLDLVTQVERVETFSALREDLDTLRRAVSMLEVVDQVAQEGEPDAALYRMLVGALRTLDETGNPVIVPAFFCKLLAHDGVRPVTDRCAECGTTVDLVAFDLVHGGALCRTHRRGQPISPEALALLDDVLGGRMNQALDRPESPATVEFEGVATRSIEVHLERRLRSVGLY
jgi:DNA repair protein RecO (recombination protein O)